MFDVCSLPFYVNKGKLNYNQCKPANWAQLPNIQHVQAIFTPLHVIICDHAQMWQCLWCVSWKENKDLDLSDLHSNSKNTDSLLK